MTRLVLMIAGVVSALLISSAAEAARWGAFKNDGCIAWDQRQYSSRLWDAGFNWDADCKATPATINGRRIATPTRCDNHGAGGMWGVWKVSDQSCRAKFDTAKIDHCVSTGKRQVSSIIRNVPPGITAMKACARTSISALGANQGTPGQCDDHGVGGVWGVWIANDASCGARWDTPKADRCVGAGKRDFSAILRDPPSGESWEAACAKTSIRIAGADQGPPDRCDNHGIGGMWGVWQGVADASCTSDDRSAEEQTRSKYDAQRGSIEARQKSAGMMLMKISTNEAVPPPQPGGGAVPAGSDAGRKLLMMQTLNKPDTNTKIVTLTSGGSGALVVGYGHMEGWAMKKIGGGTSDYDPAGYECRRVWSNTFTAGLAIGGASGEEFGEWEVDFDGLAGDSNGIQGSAGLIALNLGGGAHWAANGQFAGVTVTTSAGAGVELAAEYVHGWTGVAEETTPCNQLSW